jgi:hypothetical protein
MLTWFSEKRGLMVIDEIGFVPLQRTPLNYCFR